MDESDVYVDVHKAIRRLTPAPRARRIHAEAGAAAVGRKPGDGAALVDIAEHLEASDPVVGSLGAMSDGAPERIPKMATFMRRRGSAGPDGKPDDRPVPFKASLDEMKQQLRHLAPSNRAANPRNTRTNVFKIKQGLSVTTFVAGDGNSKPLDEPAHKPDDAADGDESTPLLNSTGVNGGQSENGYGSGKSKSDKAKSKSPERQ